MKATVTVRNLSDQFWNGFGELIPAFLNQSPIEQFKKLEVLSHEMPKNVSLKIGDNSFRQRLEWVRELEKYSQNLASKVEPRKGYKLVTFEISEKSNPVKPRKGESERKFVSRCMSEEKKSFPKQKQRIAVCLSKARKNPFNDRNLDA